MIWTVQNPHLQRGLVALNLRTERQASCAGVYVYIAFAYSSFLGRLTRPDFPHACARMTA